MESVFFVYKYMWTHNASSGINIGEKTEGSTYMYTYNEGGENKEFNKYIVHNVVKFSLCMYVYI